MSIELVMPSSHLILYHPLLLLPPIPPSIRVFSNESTLRMRWPKYWSFSFSISPSNEHPGLISLVKPKKKKSIMKPDEFFFSIAFNQCKVSLVAQKIKNLLAIQETWVWSLGLEDLLEKGMATHYSILFILFSCQVNSMDRGIWRATVHMGVTKSQTWLSDWHFYKEWLF